MSLISFFGPDGSGKTTLAKALARKLENHNLKVKISWMRGTHTVASIIARIIARFPAFRGQDNPYYRISIPSDIKRLWQLVEFISVLPILLAKFILPSILGYTVIAERYVPDFLVWVSLTTRDEDYLKRFLSRQLKLYDRLAKLVKAYKIDTTERSVEETLDSLLSLVQLSLTRDGGTLT
jgi:thymidylate kinase